MHTFIHGFRERKGLTIPKVLFFHSIWSQLFLSFYNFPSHNISNFLHTNGFKKYIRILVKARFINRLGGFVFYAKEMLHQPFNGEKKRERGRGGGEGRELQLKSTYLPRLLHIQIVLKNCYIVPERICTNKVSFFV